ncbi:ESPR-type extended signal peptide-containing protein, partial [Vreelandella aquamarina]
MNNVFRLIWNRTLGRMVVASEAARSQHKAGNGSQQVGQVPEASGQVSLKALLHPITLGVALACATILSTSWAPDVEARKFASDGGSCVSGGGGVAIGRLTTINTSADPADGTGTYSTVAGCNADGNNQSAATVYGTFSEVTGKGGAAFGFNVRAAQWATAIGLESRATGVSGTALGFGSQATGRNAVAIGGAGGADNANPLSVANSTTASGLYSIAIGADDVKGAQATVANAIAIGGQSEAAGAGAIAIGSKSTTGAATGTYAYRRKDNNGVDSGVASLSNSAIALGAEANVDAGGIAIGSNSNASGILGVAIGGSAVASSASAFALGPAAYATGSQSLSIGYQSAATSDRSLSIGPVSTSTGVESVALGTSALASGNRAFALGSSSIDDGGWKQDTVNNTQATGDDSLAFGTSAKATGESAIAVGKASQATGIDTIAIGTGAEARSLTQSAVPGFASNPDGIAQSDPLPTTAIGADALAYGGTAIGHNAEAGADGAQVATGTALGNGAKATGNNSIAVSTSDISPAQATAPNTIAMGLQAEAKGVDSIAIGTYTNFDTASGVKGVALGYQAVSAGENSVAIGYGSKATAKNTVSIGTGNVVSGEGSGAIGDPSYLSGSGTYIIGNDNGTFFDPIAADEAGVFGNDNFMSAAATGSRIIGNSNNIDVADAFVMGNNADVTEAGGVALGSNSVASTASGIAGYVPFGATAADTTAINSTIANRAAVDVGSRQITSVAAGTELDDAVNVSQLIAAQSKVEAGTNVADVAVTENSSGGTIYTVNAEGTTVSAGSAAVDVAAGTKDPVTNLTDYSVDLSQDAK